MNMKLGRLVCAAAIAALPQVSHAVLLDFSQVIPGGKEGNLGVSTYHIPNSPVTVDAFYLAPGAKAYTQSPNSKGVPVTLFVRNSDDDMGFGVCAPEDQSSSSCALGKKFKGGGGDTNELDNHGSSDLLRFKLDPAFKWRSVKLSSLSGDEGGQLWYSNVAGTAANLSSFAHLLTSYQGGHKDNLLDINLDGTKAERATYLYFTPTGKDAGHLVWQMDAVRHAPEPSTYGIFAAGICLLGVLRLRKAGK
jgi:hypothetical protein